MPHDDNRLNPRFREAIRYLHEAQIRLVVVGGLALGLHGGAQVTEDVDFSFAPEEENLLRLSKPMNRLHPRPLGWPPANPFVVSPAQLRSVRFLNLKTDLGEINLLSLPAGVDSFEGLWERAVEMDLGGFVARVASIDDLIAMKRAAGRPKDERHLMELAALQRVMAEEIR